MKGKMAGQCGMSELARVSRSKKVGSGSALLDQVHRMKPKKKHPGLSDSNH